MNDEMRTIDVTPTWRGLLPALIELAHNGTSFEARQTAWDELCRMADIADNAVRAARGD